MKKKVFSVLIGCFFLVTGFLPAGGSGADATTAPPGDQKQPVKSHVKHHRSQKRHKKAPKVAQDSNGPQEEVSDQKDVSQQANSSGKNPSRK